VDVNEVLRRAREALGVGRSFGPAYEHAGTMVIPVAFVAGGGGGGMRGAPQPGDEQQGDGQPGDGQQGDGQQGDEQAAHPAGAGGGFGGVVYPVGAYVIRDAGARFVPSIDVNMLAVCGLLLVRLLLKRSARRARHARRAH